MACAAEAGASSRRRQRAGGRGVQARPRRVALRPQDLSASKASLPPWHGGSHNVTPLVVIVKPLKTVKSMDLLEVRHVRCGSGVTSGHGAVYEAQTVTCGLTVADISINVIDSIRY